MTILSQALQNIMQIQGAYSSAIVDLETGDCLTRTGNEELFSLSLAAKVNAQMLRAELRMVHEQSQQCEEEIEDLLITLGKHYHIIRMIRSHRALPEMFFYLVMDRATANLAIARRKLSEAEQDLLSGTDALIKIEEERNKTLFPFNGKESEILEDEDELPPFMREDAVMRLLGLTPGG